MNKEHRGDNEACYLLLHMGIPTKKHPATKKDLEGMEIAQKAGIKMRVKIWPLKLTDNSKYEQFRYFFAFSDFKRNDKKATNIAECVFCAASLVLGPILASDDEKLVFPVPARLTKSVKNISIEELIRARENEDPDDASLIYELSKSTVSAGYHYSFVWKIVPVLFDNEPLLRACRFFKTSQDNVYISPGLTNEIMANPRTALTGFEQNKFEDALINAFKTVEAVLGDPPKDDRRFLQKIKDLGLDPNMRIGYTDKNPLHTVIRKMNKTRDTRAAHGGTPGDRAIGIVELAEYQACAQLITFAAIEKKLGHSIY